MCTRILDYMYLGLDFLCLYVCVCLCLREERENIKRGQEDRLRLFNVRWHGLRDRQREVEQERKAKRGKGDVEAEREERTEG